MSNWQKHSLDEMMAMVQSVASQKNIEDNAVEKDWWVTVVLKATISFLFPQLLLAKSL